MADLQDTDKFLVSRSGSSFQVDASDLMAELQDTDLMLVNRAGKSYKATGLDIKDSLGPSEAAPIIPNILLITDGSSFSGQTFTTVLPNYNAGVPAASQKFKAKISGAFQVPGETSPIESIAGSGSIRLTLEDDKDLTNGLFLVGDEVTGYDTGSNVFVLDVDASQRMIIVNGGTWSVGSTVKNTVFRSPQVSATTDEIIAVDSDAKEITLASNTDLTDFQTGDAVEQDSGYTPQSSEINAEQSVVESTVRGFTISFAPSNLQQLLDNGTEVDLGQFNAHTLNNTWLGLICSAETPGSGQVFNSDTGSGTPDMKFNNPAGNFDANGNQLDAANNPPSGPGDWNQINFSDGGTTGYIVNIKAAYTLIKGTGLCGVPQINGPALLDRTMLELQDATDLENFRVGDQVTQGPAASSVTGEITKIDGNEVTLKNVVGDWLPNVGNYMVGPDTTPGTGTVSSTNTSQNKMFLSDFDETYPKRWIVNQGKKVVGPPQDAASVDAYLTWQGQVVTGVVRDDPGYAAAPDGLELTFFDPSPTGDTWDNELPAGTSLSTRVEATNSSGTAYSQWSNAVVPRMVPVTDPEPDHLDIGARLLTFENRAAIYQGEQAQAAQDDLVSELFEDGIDATDLY